MRRRSVLFSPGDRPERVRKALETGMADVVVADLEDGVMPDHKEEARQAVRDLLQEVPECPAERAVRINAWPSTLAEDDLDTVMAGAPDLIVVPKAADPKTIAALDARLLELEGKCGVEPGATRIFLILETAAGVLSARDLVRASPRVAAIAIGAEDLAADAGMRRSADNREVATARSLVVLAAAAEGIQAIDMITADFQDLDRCRREAEEARGLGFSGKMVVHPQQVAPVHAGFAPTPDEVAWAEKVMAASVGLEAGGVVVVDGIMIDRPLIEQARRTLVDQE